MKPPPPHLDATELGEPRRPRGPRTDRKQIDLGDFDQVRALANQIAFGNSRRVTGASVEELQAVAKLAAAGAEIIWQASEVVAHSDAGSPRNIIVGEMTKLANMTRPLMGRTSRSSVRSQPQ